MKTTNRAGRKTGKNSKSTQSPKTTEKNPGETPKETVTIRAITRAGAHVPLEVSPELAERTKVETAIQLGPLTENNDGSFTGKLHIGGGVHGAIFRYSQKSGIGNFHDAFSEMLRAGTRCCERRDTRLTALDEADNTLLEIKLLFTSLRSMLHSWHTEGVPTDDHFYDLDMGLITLSHRLENSLRKSLSTVREGV